MTRSALPYSVPLIALSFFAHACSQPASDKTTSYPFVDHVDRAEATFDRVQFRSARKDARLWSPVTLGGETQSSLTPPLPSRLVYEVEIPSDPALHFSIGASPLGEGPLDAKVDFLLHVDSGGGEELIFSETIERHEPNEWREATADLRPWSGKRVKLVFETKPRLEELPSVQIPVLAAWGNPVLASTSAQPERPNLILISIDCLRPDHMGAYGYQRDTTPNIDRFAEDGVVFETAVATSSWTLPTHMSMLTGLVPSFHRATKWEKLDTSVPYLPELLSSNGYRTSGVASWVYVSQIYGFERGFHLYDVMENPIASDVVDAALSQLVKNRGQNHFLFMHLLDPHWPYLPPREFIERFGPRPRDISDLQDLIARSKPPPSDRETHEIIQLYDGEIAYTDQELGRFFAELKMLGLYEDSMIIVTADHGEAFYEHGHWQHSQTLYDEVVRIPLIVKWPGGSAGSRVASLVSQVDIFPSLLEAAGIEPPPTEAVDLALRLDGDAEPEDRTAISEVTWRSPRETSMKIAFRTTSSKFIVTLSGPASLDGGDDLGVSELEEEELYDLLKDPHEQNNLLTKTSRDLAEFHRKMRSFLDTARGIRTTRQGQQVELDEEVLERLRSLGYVDH